MDLQIKITYKSTPDLGLGLGEFVTEGFGPGQLRRITRSERSIKFAFV